MVGIKEVIQDQETTRIWRNIRHVVYPEVGTKIRTDLEGLVWAKMELKVWSKLGKRYYGKY